MTRSTTLAGTVTNTMDTNIVMVTVGVEATGETFDSTAWGEGFSGHDAGSTKYGATFEGYLTGQPGDPGGTVGNFAVSDGTNSITWTTNAFIDSWTINVDNESGEVKINGHITCNGAPAFAP